MTSADIMVQGEIVRKTMASTKVDKDAITKAYNDIRNDKSDLKWAVFKYDQNQVIVAAKGSSFEEFKAQFGDDERAFAYLRVETGDEISRRAKFMMLTWVGTGVSAIKRAKMSTDKALIKEILLNFAMELTIETSGELDEVSFQDQLNKAGGANYGTGM